jgi:KUP system potassium uptake protein
VAALFAGAASPRKPAWENTLIITLRPGSSEANALPSGTTREQTRRNLFIGALGVVFGDIGTSPLYALRQSINTVGTSSDATILGVLSLITWALILVVTTKYVLVVMRADNRGEGGILALTALALRSAGGSGRRRAIVAIGLLGAALFYGDCIITPAISVLSAAEGLKVATPALEPFVIPFAIALLILLFAMQSHGTARVGRLFGPVILVWFVTLALLGINQIVQHPEILRAVNPVHGATLLVQNPWLGFVLLGAVVLAVTGAEALYADMGHFGRDPIRLAWLWLVFPALLLNYFGQGALLLREPEALENPFFHLAPDWALYPILVLAAAATIIASQAVISGAFSITRQAIQLGYLPRLEVRHTSAAEMGQIFVPRINQLLLIAVMAVVVGFKTSDDLGAAYGVAVTGTMTMTTLLAFVYMRRVLGWNLLWAGTLFGALLLLDLAFFGASLAKLPEGGWLPIVIAAAIYVVMTTWRAGRAVVTEQRAHDAMPLDQFLGQLRPDHPPRVPGTAIFLTGNIGVVPAALLHNIKHNKALHERVVLMTVQTEDIPRVAEEHRLEIQHHEHGFHAIIVRYGFMDEPDVPRALAQCRGAELCFNLMETSFFVGREKIITARRSGWARWRRQLFVMLSNNMLDATEFFRIPANRVVELGGQVEV